MNPAVHKVPLSTLLTSVIDAEIRRDAAVCDIPKVFIQTSRQSVVFQLQILSIDSRQQTLLVLILRSILPLWCM